MVLLREKGIHHFPPPVSLLGYWRAPLLALLSLALVLAASLPAKGADKEDVADRTGWLPAELARELEARTGKHLERIQALLEARLDQDEPGLSEKLRTACIQFSMWGPMAGISRQALETLGDSDAARTGLFFLMPLVRWLSEPFLFPVETDGTPEERDMEIDRLLKFIAGLGGQRIAVSLDNVGDASLSREEATAYKDYYLSLIRRFAQVGGADELCMSLKLSALTCDLDAALDPGDQRREIKAALVELLQAAATAPERRIFLRIDMEEYAYKDLTLLLFREVVEENPGIVLGNDGRLRLGVVIQAYLRDAAADVHFLADWAKGRGLRAPIRLVKGAYLGHERQVAAKAGRKCPVWNHKPSTDASFEAASALMLLRQDAVEPAFATHNIRSQAHVMALGEVFAIEQSALEFQMLYGMGDPIKAVIVELGHSLREYVPAGSLARGLKYAGRRFQELSSSDNALARTMRGNFSVVSGGAPDFVGEEDQEDGRKVEAILAQTVSRTLASPLAGSGQQPPDDTGGSLQE
jgi:hypothetical protein